MKPTPTATATAKSMRTTLLLSVLMCLSTTMKLAAQEKEAPPLERAKETTEVLPIAGESCQSSKEEPLSAPLLVKTLNDGITSAIGSIQSRWKSWLSTPAAFSLTLKDYFKDMNDVKETVKRRIDLYKVRQELGADSADKAKLHEFMNGDLDYELGKDLRTSSIPGWPQYQGKPLMVYGQIFDDVSRVSFKIKNEGNKDIYHSQKDRENLDLSNEAKVLILFNQLKLALINSILDINEKRAKQRKEEYVLDDDIMNETIHRILASRTQTFDANMWALINAQVKPQYAPPIVNYDDSSRIHTFTVKGNKILVTTETRFSVKYNDFNHEHPHMNSKIGAVNTVRSMEFDGLSGEFSDEEFQIKKNPTTP